MKDFPILYKKTNTGKIQFWLVSVKKINGSWYVCTKYGQVGTSSPQRTRDKIKSGKNIGRSNETSPERQARAEANSKWEKQKKKGYVESITDAESGKIDSIIKGGMLPMLAANFRDHGHKIKFPCFGQYKYDGHRCIGIVTNGSASLWSRTRKRITSMPHIEKELERQFKEMNIVLDGELYNHKYKDNFEQITKMIRPVSPIKGHEIVQYHVYDLIQERPFHKRLDSLLLIESNEIIRIAATKNLTDEDHAKEFMSKSLTKGFEGIMLRNRTAIYQHCRTSDLQKMKEMKDAEYKIVGIEEGRGKLEGHVGAFWCEDEKGKRFKAKMKGSTKNLKKMFEKPKMWKGKMLTVQYQELTGKNGVPRFPVGLRIREDV